MKGLQTKISGKAFTKPALCALFRYCAFILLTLKIQPYAATKFAEVPLPAISLFNFKNYHPYCAIIR
jgi:hypothetical protein